MPTKMQCKQCGFVASNELCKACILLEGLNKGKARVAIGRKEFD
jgi:cytoplasmic tRNA 2-thiolation protein 1